MKFVSATVEITPDMPVFLGCGPPYVVACPPDAGFEANLILLTDESDNRVLLISIDALYVGPLLRQLVDAELGQHFEPSEVFFAASHSHNAPMLDDTKPKLGAPNVTHVTNVASRISLAAKELLARETIEVSMTVWDYRAKTAVNRRWRRPIVVLRGGVSFFRVQTLPNPIRRLRPKAEVVEFHDSQNGLVGLIWIMPCHPTSFPAADGVTAHYIGYVRDQLRLREQKRDLPVVFFQGASGDLRPPAYKPVERSFRGLMARLRRGRDFSAFLEEEYSSWVERVYEEFTKSRRHAALDSGGNGAALISVRRESIALEELIQYEYGVRRYFTCHLVRLGGFRIVGISAEPTWAIRSGLSRKFQKLTVVGCIDDTFGYLTSVRQFRAGGYEAFGFHEAFSLSNIKRNFSPKKATRFVERALK